MLNLSTKGRYATRIVIRLALLAEQARPARRKEIAEAEDISEDYTEQILIRLKAAGLVESTRGVHGGFRLSKPADTLTVAHVLETVEGPIHLAPCSSEPCERGTACITRELWLEAQEALLTVFRRTTIGQLCERARRKGALAVNFHI